MNESVNLGWVIMIFANDEGILIKFSTERRDIGIAASPYTLSFS